MRAHDRGPAASSRVHTDVARSTTRTYRPSAPSTAEARDSPGGISEFPRTPRRIEGRKTRGSHSDRNACHVLEKPAAHPVVIRILQLNCGIVFRQQGVHTWCMKTSPAPRHPCQAGVREGRDRSSRGGSGRAVKAPYQLAALVPAEGRTPSLVPTAAKLLRIASTRFNTA
jgi:hypothetical protein